jgi:hypothetical protein
MIKKRNATTKLLDDIIKVNTDILKDKTVDADTKFKAQDRILKALTLKERQAKKSGGKFDLGNRDE